LSKIYHKDAMVRVEDVINLIEDWKNNNFSHDLNNINSSTTFIVQKINSVFATFKNTIETETKTILNNLPAMIGMWNSDLVNIMANNIYSEYFGMTPEEIKGQHIQNILGLTLFKKNLPFMQKVLLGEIQQFERDISLPNGTIRNTLTTYIPNKDHDLITGFFVIVTDISEVKEKSYRIQDQKNFYSHILNSMHEGYAILNKQGQIIFYNNTAANILGLSEEQLLGKSSLVLEWQAIREDGSIFQGEDHPGMQTIKTGLPTKNIIMGIQPNGKETKWINVNAIPFNAIFENNEASAIVTFIDVTLQFQKDKLIAGIVANSPGMTYQYKMSKDGLITFPFVSSKIYDIYEITKDDLILDPGLLQKAIHPEDSESLQVASFKSAETLEIFEWKGRIVTPSKKIKWISIKGVPHKERGGSLVWDGIVLDITQEVELQLEIAQIRMRATHSAKLASLGEMSAGVAHEINNPLTIILGMSKLLANSFDNPESFARKIREIDKSVMRIAKIVNGLKRFARVEVTSKKEIHCIQNIISSMDVYIELKSKTSSTEFIINSSSLSPILCDALEIEQVMINLINNSLDAIKFKSNKWINIQIYDRAPYLIIRVTDSGNGIEKEILSKLFDPFFTTKEVGEGTGLGLSISLGIIKDHGGDLLIISDCPNTCFEIRLPLVLT
jgi:PAS domain S-box-containing protein